MAATGNTNLVMRGGPNYGYPVAAGIHVYAGAFLTLNAAGTLQRPQDSGSVAFAGVADRELDNSASATVSTLKVVAQRGVVIRWTVPSATYTNIGAAVYLTDDNTMTLTQSGSLLQIGTLDGFDQGTTWVKVSN